MAGRLARHPDIAERAKRLRGEGLGFRMIAKKLKEEFNFNISHMGIKTYFDNIGVQAMGIKKRSITQISKEDLRQEILDTTKQLKKINEEMWTLYNEIKGAGKDKFGVARMNLLDKILRQLEFNSRQLGRITSTAVNITQINYVDFAVAITNYLKKWEEEGYIKILKPPIPEAEEK